MAGAWTLAVQNVFNRKLSQVDYSAIMVYHGLLGFIAVAIWVVVEGAAS